MKRLSRAFEFTMLAVRNLVGYPLRSLLTTLGVVFGIVSVVAMLALGRGAEEEILRDIEQKGITNVIVNSVKPPDDNRANEKRRWMSSYGVTFKDMEQIAATVPGVARVIPVHSYTQRAWHGSRKENVEVIGIPPEYFQAARLSVAPGGRAFTEGDERERRTICVVHLALLRSLGWYGEPIGFKIMVGEMIYEVVGVLEDEEFQGHLRKALASPGRGENMIYAPYQTVLSRVGTMSFQRSSGSFQSTNIELNTMIVEAQDQATVIPVARMVRAILEKFHEQKDYEIVVPLEQLAQARQVSKVFTVTLLIIAGISLLVGGIGIANIMLASVTERTREIGIRRAIGAKRRHVMSQFLIETITLSAFGGLLGVGLSPLAVHLLRSYTGFEARLSWDVAGVALLVSGVVGVLSGVFPAWRASRLDPIQALRYE